jgi:hypothetical protein
MSRNPDPRPRVLPGHDPQTQVRGAVAGALAGALGFAFADLPPESKERLVDEVLALSGDWPNGEGLAWHDAAHEVVFGRLAARVPGDQLAAHTADGHTHPEK